ncbi:hypothetical protein ACHAXA_006481 [Cyclostephanos tholiformis]|uniref:Vacuolar ATPase assembly integral membrane protein VMA21 homolog n=1 Tax=Cyclostephanos tholiformis TaxID=382380 RepID=A0ABD3RZG3_9STRA
MTNDDTLDGIQSLFHEQNREVARKLGTATFLMFTLPILAFYLGLYYLFPNYDEPLMWSGLFAVFLANVVIAGYVVSAFMEGEDDVVVDSQRRGFDGETDGDAAGPRVGAFKQRTD